MEDPGVRVEITSPNLGEFVRPIFATGLNVNHSPHEFRLVFSQITIPLEVPPEAVEAGELKVTPEAVVDLRIPASVMYGVLQVLQEQFSKYLDTYGPPGMNPEGPGR